MIALAIEYMIHNGDLPALQPLVDYTVEDKGDGEVLIWTNANPEPTAQQIQDVIDSASFQTYVTNRPNINLRKRLKRLLDDDDHKLLVLGLRGLQQCINTRIPGNPITNQELKNKIISLIDNETT